MQIWLNLLYIIKVEIVNIWFINPVFVCRTSIPKYHIIFKFVNEYGSIVLYFFNSQIIIYSINSIVINHFLTSYCIHHFRTGYEYKNALSWYWRRPRDIYQQRKISCLYAHGVMNSEMGFYTDLSTVCCYRSIRVNTFWLPLFSKVMHK